MGTTINKIFSIISPLILLNINKVYYKIYVESKIFEVENINKLNMFKVIY